MIRQLLFKKRMIAIIAISLSSVFYMKHNNNKLQFPQSNKGNKDRQYFLNYNDTRNYLLNNSACYIPKINISKLKPGFSEKRKCYKGAVFIEKISDDKIKFRIDYDNLKMKKANALHCQYQFAFRWLIPGRRELVYSNKTTFTNGTIVNLDDEIVFTECCIMASKHVHEIISCVEDAFLIVKKKLINDREAQYRKNILLMKENWNILILSINGMSRAQAYRSIPKAVDYMKKRGWLDYLGYTKVAFDLFSNSMAILTGKNDSSTAIACSHGIDLCRDYLIWDKFKEATYVTAFGEDNLKFSKSLYSQGGFSFPPTDHYASPFFLNWEYRLQNILCTRNKLSAQHLIEYASQFAQTYHNDSFFGYFSINSFVNDLNITVTLFQNSIINFFENLTVSTLLNNTFVFLLSNQGKPLDKNLISRESFYEERLPMLFIWVPYEYRETYAKDYYNLQTNQYRLTTPYDVHATLWKLMKLTNKDVDVIPPEACPLCEGLTEKIKPERTCEESHINENWCSCHDLIQAENDPAAKRSLELAIDYIKNISRSIKTKACTRCSALKLIDVLGEYRYVKGAKIYYRIAFRMNPASVTFEALVENYRNKLKILNIWHDLSKINQRSYCALQHSSTSYCICEKIFKCKS